MSTSTINKSFVAPIDGELLPIQLSNKVTDHDDNNVVVQVVNQVPDLDNNLIKFLDFFSLGPHTPHGIISLVLQQQFVHHLEDLL